MHVIPSDDSFDYGNAGSDPYGTFLLGYLGWEPKSGVDAGLLVRSGAVGPGRAWAIGEEDIATNDDVPVAFMRRQSFQADCSVRAAFKFTARQGVATQDHGYELGVFARATGGTLTDDGTEFVHYVDGSAYAALLTRTGTDAYDLTIARWSGGTETTLATKSLTLIAPTLVSKALRLRLDCVTNVSGDVELSAQVQNLAAYDVTPKKPSRPVGGFQLPGASVGILDIEDDWTELLSHTDSSGSKLTSAGRCGFLIEREREYDSGATRIVTAISNFTVRTEAETILFADGFKRAAINLGRPFTDAWSDPATSVQGDWTHDLFSVEQDASVMLRRDTAAEEVTQTPTASPGSSMNLTPATSDYLSIDLSDAGYVGAIPLRSATLFTWACRTNLDANAAGNVLWDDFLSLGNGQSIGFTLGLTPGGAANTFRMYAIVSGTGTSSGTTYETADIAEASILSTTAHLAWTLSSANDRVRFYLNGTLQVERAMTEDPEIRGATETRVGWNGTAGATTANFLDGRVDDLRLYWLELDAAALQHLAATSLSGVGTGIDFPSLGLLIDFEAAQSQVATLGGYFPATHGVSPGVSWAFEGSAATTTGISAAARTRAYSASQRPVDDDRNQNRAVTVELADVNTTAGPFVRGALAADGTFTGYRLDVRPAPDAVALLYRVNSGAETLLAQASITLALSTQYVVQLQVSRSNSGQPDSASTLAAYLGGTQIVLVAETAADNVFADSAGTIRDASTNRIASGKLEGFHILTPGGTGATDIDTWAQGPLDNLTFAIEGDSIVLRSEVSGVTGNLTDGVGTGNAPLQPLRRAQLAHIDVARYESSHPVRKLRGEVSRRGFESVSFLLSDSELTAFRTFFNDHRASEIPFLWTPPDEAQGTFSFGRPQFTATPIVPGQTQVTFDLIERLDYVDSPPALLTPAQAPGRLFWCSAQTNCFTISPTPDAVPDDKTKTFTSLLGPVDRWSNADAQYPSPTDGSVGRHLSAAFSDSVGNGTPRWGLVEFASTAVINGKRTIESRENDVYYLANPNLNFYVLPWWGESGFTFIAHIIPPTSGYGASEHILRLADPSGNEICRVGWTTSQFYAVPGVVIAGGALSGYDLGGSTAAKTIVVRWQPNSPIRIYDGGGAAVASTSASIPALPLAVPLFQSIFQSSTSEGTALSPDADIGTRLFLQEVAAFSRGLTDDEINGIGSYFAAQYGSTWTDLA